MKKILIFISCLLIFNQEKIDCQNDCGSITTPQTESLRLARMGSMTGCSDDYSAYDDSQIITYNLILNYNTYDNGTGGFTQADKDNIEADIEATFDAPIDSRNIKFNYLWRSFPCSECFSNYDNWPTFSSSDYCINGQVLYPGTAANYGGLAHFESGRFYSQVSSVPHEIGHVLGLEHTFKREDPQEGVTEERVTRDENNQNCLCNCLEKGDFVCDTPPDPYYFGFSQAANNWNNAMFAYSPSCHVSNDNQEKDDCLDLYNSSPPNVMSYECISSTLTRGQGIMIRRMTDLDPSNPNSGYKYQTPANEPLLVSSQPILTPTTINSDIAYDGDIEVRSELRIENCDFELTPGSLIIIKPGGKLIVKNSTVKTYEGSQCFQQQASATNWGGIKIEPSANTTSLLRITHQSTIEASDQGIFTEGSGLLDFKIYDSNVTSEINLSNTIGIQRLRESSIYGNINLTDNFVLFVEGSELYNTLNCKNTHLRVTDAYTTGNRTKFNLGTTSTGNNGIIFNSSNAHTMFVLNTDMINCNNCIDISNTMGLVRISDCNLTLANIGDGNEHHCIKIDDVEDFEIYQNSFSGGDILRQFGIEYNSMTSENANANIIVDNTFDGLKNGIKNANGDFGNSLSGIEFKCNYFYQCQSK